MPLEVTLKDDPNGEQGDVVVRVSRDGQKLAEFDLTKEEMRELAAKVEKGPQSGRSSSMDEGQQEQQRQQ